MDKLVNDARRTLCIMQLTEQLPVFRARLRLSQEELSELLGITRQSYNALETKTRPMKWRTCMAMIAFFMEQPKTRKMLLSDSNIYSLFVSAISLEERESKGS